MSDDKTIITDSVGLTQFGVSKKKKACLVQYSGNSLGKRYILDQPEVTIGRSPETHICIQEAGVSRQHAKCLALGDRVDIEDCGSVNGTFVNDRRVDSRAALRDGDIIRVGPILLKYFAHDNIENVFHDKIYRMATIDAGTQIFNKKYLMEQLEAEFNFSKVYSRDLSIILYDLDFFKKVNDIYGHNAGDHILKESAELAKSCVRKDDVIGRFGGEEFCIVLPNTDAKTAYELAERIRRKIEAHPFTYDGKTIQQTISMGVSQLTGGIRHPQALLEDADKKLYKSKNAGRNRVTI